MGKENYQQTIGKEATFEGKGLHTGKPCRLVFKPAPVDYGVVFRRTDLEGTPGIKALVENVVPTEIYRRTTLGNKEGVYISTVEHILATLLGLGIDNVIMELDNIEPPFVDGSALPFVETLLNAGITAQQAPRHYFAIEEPLVFRDGEVEIVALPAERFVISFFVDFNHPVVGKQAASFDISAAIFQNDIAPARTFCFLEEVEEFRRQGLIKGGSLDSAVVIGPDRVLNKSLRFPDEIVRHKILDFMGDLLLIGYPIKGHIIANKSGHAANIKFVQKLKSRQQRRVEPKSYSAPMDIQQIASILPHRYPFLLVDRVVELEEGKRVVGLKNVTINEPFFQGHFPQRAIMPGVLLIEAMAQVGGILVLSRPEAKGKLAYLAGLDKVRFRKPVVPGDQLRIEVEFVSIRSSTGKARARVFVDETVVAEGEVIFAIAR